MPPHTTPTLSEKQIISRDQNQLKEVSILSASAIEYITQNLKEEAVKLTSTCLKERKEYKTKEYNILAEEIGLINLNIHSLRIKTNTLQVEEGKASIPTISWPSITLEKVLKEIYSDATEEEIKKKVSPIINKRTPKYTGGSFPENNTSKVI